MFVRSLEQRSSNHNYSLHTQRVFTQDWLNSFWIPLSALSCLLYRRVSCLINALEGECLCLLEISINVNKSLAELLLRVYLFFRLSLILLFVVAFLLLNPFFILMLLLVYFFISFFILMLLYFSLFVYHVNKPIIFIFGAFVKMINKTAEQQQIKNSISIFVTLCLQLVL